MREIIKIMEKIAEMASKKRKGKPFHYDKREFYEQYEKRARRAGTRTIISSDSDFDKIKDTKRIDFRNQ